METIETKGFYIFEAGDHSVGIPDGEWKLTGYFSFDSKRDLDEFKIELEQLFAWYQCYGIPGVQTFEEHEEQIKKENEIYEKLSNELENGYCD